MLSRPVGAFQRALVTGASSGIGRALALELAARGAEVWLAARRLNELDDVATEIRRRGGRAQARTLDVADARLVVARVRAWDAECGGFDLVVANAGAASGDPARALDWEEVERVLQVNVLGACATLVAAAEPMAARRTGTLAGVSSLAGRRGMARSGAYSASKAALSTFVESLGIELRPRGVRVVDVRPGFVATPMTARNEFEMPWLWTVERAARRIADALERGHPVAAFPWQMALLAGLSRWVPSRWWPQLARGLAEPRGG